jgi:hypothetical protein
MPPELQRSRDEVVIANAVRLAEGRADTSRCPGDDCNIPIGAHVTSFTLPRDWWKEADVLIFWLGRQQKLQCLATRFLRSVWNHQGSSAVLPALKAGS